MNMQKQASKLLVRGQPAAPVGGQCFRADQWKFQVPLSGNPAAIERPGRRLLRTAYSETL
jgi:hypothetical protein